jgi:hypothetical protein
VVDGRVIDGGLNDVSLARVVSIRQLLAHFDKRDAALVAKNQGKTFEIPTIYLCVRRALLNKLDEGGADSRRIHSGQHLTRPRTRNRHSPHLQVSEAGPLENQGAHFRGNRLDHSCSRQMADRQMGRWAVGTSTGSIRSNARSASKSQIADFRFQI